MSSRLFLISLRVVYMRKIESISNYKEYLICIRKWNYYSSDEQETLRACIENTIKKIKRKRSYDIDSIIRKN
jgi:hypothetical protein